MDNTLPLVVVFSRNYSSALSVIRCLGAAGYPVELFAAVNTPGHMEIAAASRHLQGFTEVVEDRETQQENDALVVQALTEFARNHPGKLLLLPTCGHTTNLLDRNRDALAAHFSLPGIIGGENGALNELHSRAVLRALAADAGVKVRLEWYFQTDAEPVLPDDMVFPCICRRTSDSGRKMKSVVCADEEEFNEYFSRLRAKEAVGTVRVREYLDFDEEIEVPGLCLDQQVLMPAVIRKAQSEENQELFSRLGQVDSIGVLGQAREHLAAMLRKLHYVGTFNFHLRMVDGVPYFRKLYFHCGRSNFALLKSGVNLPAMYADYVAGKELLSGTLEAGKHFLYEQSAWEDHVAGHLTGSELRELENAAQIRLICDEDDPAPGKIFLNKMRKADFKGKLRLIKRHIRRTLRRVKRAVVPKLRKCKHFLLGYPQSRRKNARDPQAEKPRVVVCGRNYCSNLCLARAFGAAGYEVEILRIFQVKPKRKDIMKMLKPDAYSKYVKAYHVCVAKRKNSRIVKKLLSIADRERKMLLIPADDYVANVVDDSMNKLRNYYVIPNVDDKQGEINRLMSKSVQKELAEQAGLPVINSCVIRTENGEFTIPDSVRYPCFMKPNVSKNGLKSRMRRCENEEELSYWLTEFSQKKDIEMLVQDYVEIGREFSILGLSTKNGAIGPGFFGALEGGHEDRRGIALTGEVVDTTQRQQLIDDIMAFIGGLKFEGIFDVDLIETTDGKMYFVELNMRFGGSGYAITASGVNLPGMFADYMLMGKEVDMNCRLEQPGKHFVSEKIMVEEYMKSFLTMKDIRRHMAQADIHFIMDRNDPKPYRHFRMFYPVAMAYRVMLKQKAKRAAKNAQ